MFKILLVLLSFGFTSSLFGWHDVYTFRTYGNLKARIEIQQFDDKITDDAFRCAELSSHITNSLFPDCNVYLEIYTIASDDKENFFAGFGNGKISRFSNYTSITKKDTTDVREHWQTDSLDSEMLVIRYVSDKPNFNHLARFIYVTADSLQYIKTHQQELNYRRYATDWVFYAVDTTISQNWWKTCLYDDNIVNLQDSVVFSSKVCNNHQDFTFTYEQSKFGYLIKHKTIDSISVECPELYWYSIGGNFGVFVTTDSSFHIVDSSSGLISEEQFIQTNFSQYRSIFFSRKSKYAVELSVMNFDNVNYQHDRHSWVYRPNGNLLIDVSGLDEKQIKKVCKKKYQSLENM